MGDSRARSETVLLVTWPIQGESLWSAAGLSQVWLCHGRFNQAISARLPRDHFENRRLTKCKYYISILFSVPCHSASRPSTPSMGPCLLFSPPWVKNKPSKKCQQAWMPFLTVTCYPDSLALSHAINKDTTVHQRWFWYPVFAVKSQM